MEGENSVTPSIIDRLHSWYIQGDEMEGGSGLSRSIIDELGSSDWQGDQLEGERGVTRKSSMNVILRISKEIKWKVKIVLL